MNGLYVAQYKTLLTYSSLNAFGHPLLETEQRKERIAFTRSNFRCITLYDV